MDYFRNKDNTSDDKCTNGQDQYCCCEVFCFTDKDLMASAASTLPIAKRIATHSKEVRDKMMPAVTAQTIAIKCIHALCS